MAEILLFHHAQGLTPGVIAFADELRAGGHVVHTPDLFDGKTFLTVDDGVAHVRSLGFGPIIERGVAAAEGLPKELVYSGMSLGVMSAQKLTQTRPGAKGGLFFYSFVPPAEFDSEWPEGVPAQIHMMDQDQWALEGDIDAAQEFTKSVKDAELFLYPGEKHLFLESSTTDYDEPTAKLATQRALGFLAALG